MLHGNLPFIRRKINPLFSVRPFSRGLLRWGMRATLITQFMLFGVNVGSVGLWEVQNIPCS